MFEFTRPAENGPQSPRSLAVSIVVHTLAIFLLFTIQFSSVGRFPSAPEHFTLIAPSIVTPVVPQKIHAPRARAFRPLPPAPANLSLPSVSIITAPVIETPKAALPEIPRLAAPFVASLPAIKASAFTEANPAAPVPAPKPVVSPAGFESTETSTTGPARSALPAIGSFESPHSAEGAPARKTVTRPGAFSEASTESSTAAHRTAVTSAAFGDTTVEKGAPAPKQSTAAARLTPVEIVSKPRPAYTAEARAKNIEGEVLLEVQFNVSGDVRVLRVVRGLGHGLDETAVAAAQGIGFRPATRDGAAVDSTALVHIVFQLAN